jgi:hypothetical protein
MRETSKGACTTEGESPWHGIRVRRSAERAAPVVRDQSSSVDGSGGKGVDHFIGDRNRLVVRHPGIVLSVEQPGGGFVDSLRTAVSLLGPAMTVEPYALPPEAAADLRLTRHGEELTGELHLFFRLRDRQGLVRGALECVGDGVDSEGRGRLPYLAQLPGDRRRCHDSHDGAAVAHRATRLHT